MAYTTYCHHCNETVEYIPHANAHIEHDADDYITLQFYGEISCKNCKKIILSISDSRGLEKECDFF
jgi:phage FluMu protein Com